MQRLRNSDVKSVLDNKYLYLWCVYRPNKPMLHHLICEKSCQKYKGAKYNDCIYYKDWYYSERQIELPNSTERRRRK